MKIEAYFLDTKGNVTKRVKGIYDDEKKKFIYRAVLGIFKPREIPLDINNTFTMPNGVKIAFFDAQNNQIAINENASNINRNLIEYIKDLQNSLLVKELALERPKGLEDIIPIIAMLTMLGLLLLAYYTIKDLTASFNVRFDALNRTINAFEFNQQLLYNLTKKQIEIYNKYCIQK